MARRPTFARELASVASAAAVVLVARSSLADHYRVPSGSMEPTIHVGDHVVVSKLAYGVRVPFTTTWLTHGSGPARGDVVVLDLEEPGSPDVLLKRVVAVGGDWVEVRGGSVFIDGRPVDEPGASRAEGPGPDLAPTRVPPEHVLVLGDNRGNSRDGRSFGFVDRRRVLGRVQGLFRGMP